MLLPCVLLCGVGWDSALCGVLLAAGCYILYVRAAGSPLPPPKLYVRAFGLRAGKCLSLASAAAFVLLAGWLAQRSTAFFPETQTVPWAGLGVLTLAALCARAGTASALRCGSILLLPLAAALAAVLLCAVPSVDPRRLTPQPALRGAGAAASILLLPAVGLFLLPEVRAKNARPALWLPVPALLLPASALIAGGVLPPSRLGRPDAFVVLARSVTVFGVMLRLEALISAALTACAFLGCALLLCAARQAAASCLQGCKKPLPYAATVLLSAAAELTAGALPAGVILLLPGIFCGLLPLAAQGVVRLKKDEK